MAFNAINLDRVGIPSIYDRYKYTTDDTLAETITANYFDLSLFNRCNKTNPIVEINAKDGNTICMIDDITGEVGFLPDGGLSGVGVDELVDTVNFLYEKELWIEQFGAKPEFGFDNTPAIEAAALALGAGVLRAGYGKFEMASTAFIPIGVYIEGVSGNRGFDDTYDNTTCFAPTSDAALTENYLFFMNIDPDGDTNTWVEAYPNNDSGGASHLTIDGDNLAGGCNGFKFAGSHIFKNITNKKVATLISKPSSTYTDKLVIDQIHSINRATDTDYLFEIPGTGDGYTISNIETGYLNGQAGITKGINLGRCRAGQVFGLINGEHMFNGCKSVEIYGSHIEGGSITLKDCNAHVHDNILFTEEDVSGQIIFDSDNSVFGNRYSALIDNNIFDQSMNRRGGFQQTTRPDIIINSAFSINLKNNKRKITDSSALSLHQYHGVLVGTDATTMLDEHNNYSHLFSNYECLIIANQVVQSGIIPSQNKVFGGVAATSETIEDTAFNGATANYYYHAQIIQDPIRMLGKTGIGGESSLAITNGGDICKLSIDWNTTVNQGCAILRVYRGTATGAYTEFVDIPIVSCKNLYDTGVNISGFVWQTRASGGVDSLNAGINEAIILADGLLDMKSVGGKPTVGSWRQGDELRKINPTPPGSGLSVNNRFLRITTGNAQVNGTDWLIFKNEQS